MVLFQFSEKKSKNKVFSILVIEVLVICLIQAPQYLGCCTVNFKGKGVAHTGIGNFLGEGLDNYDIVKNIEMWQIY